MILTVDAYGNQFNERVYYMNENPVPACNQQGGCAVPAKAIFGLSTNAQPALGLVRRGR